MLYIAAHAADPDPTVRRAVATALRKTPGLVAHEALGALMADANPQVSRAAVRALGHHPLAADDLTGLAARVQASELGPSTHGALIDLLVRHGDLDPAARRALRLALAARATDGRVRARLAHNTAGLPAEMPAEPVREDTELRLGKWWTRHALDPEAHAVRLAIGPGDGVAAGDVYALLGAPRADELNRTVDSFERLTTCTVVAAGLELSRARCAIDDSTAARPAPGYAKWSGPAAGGGP